MYEFARGTCLFLVAYLPIGPRQAGPLRFLIKLCRLYPDLVTSGGRTSVEQTNKHQVTVDGQPESRKTAKIRAGQVVMLGDIRIAVHEAD